MKLGIGKEIVEKLAKVTALDGKVFPLVAPQTTTPFAVYQCAQTTADYTKDKQYANTTATITLNIYANTYQESIDIAQQVINQCNSANTYVSDASEDYIDDIYTQTLTIQATYKH